MGHRIVRLSREGRGELEAELAHLEAERPAAAARIADARIAGADPAENLDLRDALDALSLLEGRLAEVRAVLAAAEPLEPAPGTQGIAQLGSYVEVRHADGEVAIYVLVAPPEADPRRGKVSIESPIGRALLGGHAGEVVTAETPGGPEALTLLEVG